MCFNCIILKILKDPCFKFINQCSNYAPQTIQEQDYIYEHVSFTKELNPYISPRITKYFIPISKKGDVVNCALQIPNPSELTNFVTSSKSTRYMPLPLKSFQIVVHIILSIQEHVYLGSQNICIWYLEIAKRTNLTRTICGQLST